MVIGLQRHLGLAVRGPRPRPPHLNTPATERDLPILVAMPDRRHPKVLRAPGQPRGLGRRLLESSKHLLLLRQQTRARGRSAASPPAQRPRRDLRLATRRALAFPGNRPLAGSKRARGSV